MILITFEGEVEARCTNGTNMHFCCDALSVHSKHDSVYTMKFSANLANNSNFYYAGKGNKFCSTDFFFFP